MRDTKCSLETLLGDDESPSKFKKSRKVIFLDFDGVIVTRATKYMYPSARPLRHLQDIVNTTGANVVVTSVWRINRTLQELRSLLNPPGFSIPVIDTTPIKRDRERGDEITEWLNRNEGIERYVILDDDTDMTIHISKLVRTQSFKGLRRKDKLQAIQLLGKKEEDKWETEELDELMKQIEELSMEDNPRGVDDFIRQFKCDYNYLTDVDHILNVCVTQRYEQFQATIARYEYHVQCSCGASGPCRNTLSEAIRTWLF